MVNQNDQIIIPGIERALLIKNCFQAVNDGCLLHMKSNVLLLESSNSNIDNEIM